LEQILPVIEHADIGVPRQRDELSVRHTAGEDRGQMLLYRVARKRHEVDEVCGQNAAPDDVELEYVDIGGLGCENLLEQSEALARGIGHRHQTDLIAGRARPGLRAFAAQLELTSERAARDRDGFGGGVET